LRTHFVTLPLLVTETKVMVQDGELLVSDTPNP
jgi:hypothetical protein